MTHRQNSMAHLIVYAMVLIIPLSTVTRENMTYYGKDEYYPHQQQQSNLYQ